MISYLVMDVDGTLTDGKLYIGENGEICKAFNIKDGYAIREILARHRIVPVIITGRSSKIIENRCAELGVTELHQGVQDKVEEVLRLADRCGGTLNELAYIGDDVNDFAAMKRISEAGGKTGCPKDAVAEIKQISDFISTRNGGDGAVREFIEWLCN